MTLVWTVENQDAVGKWFRVTPKLFENRFDAIELCNTLRERWAKADPGVPSEANLRGERRY